MQEPAILEGAEEFTFGSGRTGALLVHGFTGSPRSMRDLGEHLGQRGLSVRGVRLPGHGTTWQDLNTKTSEDWTRAVHDAYRDFAGSHDEVFVVALSFGVALALDLAAGRPEKLAGVVGIAGFIKTNDPLRFLAPVVPRFLRSLPGVGNDICLPGQDELCYDRLPTRAAAHVLSFVRKTRARLGEVSVPILLMHSRNDHTAPPEGSQIIFDSVSSDDKQLVWYDRSYHVLTMDHDREDVFGRTYDFITRRSRLLAQ